MNGPDYELKPSLRLALAALTVLVDLGAAGWLYFSQPAELTRFTCLLPYAAVVWPLAWWFFSSLAVRAVAQGVFTLAVAAVSGLPYPWQVAVIAVALFQEAVLIQGERRTKIGSAVAVLILLLGTICLMCYRAGSTAGILAVLTAAAGAGGMGVIIGSLHQSLAGERDRMANARIAAAQLAEANVRLQDYSATQEALAVAEERNRMAREIHDTLGHTLTSILVKLESFDALILEDPQRAVAELETIRGAASEGLRDVRASVAALRASIPDGAAGPERWLQLIAMFREVTGVLAETKIQENLADLPEEIDHTVYRAIQEGLTNAYRHGRAAKVLIEVWWEDDLLLMLISDNGRGMAITDKPASGYGLQGIQERVTALGGSMATRSWPGRGFDLGLQIPYQGR